ncbi:MAG: hypothetical protein WCB14_10165 [Candidatus Acidiferrales bacterium]
MKKLIAFSASLLRMCLLVGLREIWDFGAAPAFRLHWFETEVVRRDSLCPNWARRTLQTYRAECMSFVMRKRT